MIPELLQERAKLASQFKALTDTIAQRNDEPNEDERDALDDVQKRVGKIDAKVKLLKAAEEMAANMPAGDSRASKPNPLPHQDESNTRRGRHGYSLLKVLRQGDRVDGLEREVSLELAKRSEHTPQGCFVPLDLGVTIERRSGEVTKTAAAGAVPEIVSMELIDILRNRMLMRQLGATILNDLTGGTFAIPKVTATGTAYHVAETTALTAKSSQTIGQVEFVPVKLGAYSEYSKDLIKQTSIDVENWLRTDLATVIAIEFDRVGFNGSGSGSEPEGIMQNSSVNSVAIGTSGGDPTWAKIVELEKAVEVDNALAGSLAYVTSAAGRYKLKTTPRVANYPDYIWEMNEVNGYPAYSTNQIPANLTKSSGSDLTAVIFGDFSAAMYGLWGGLDVVVNPYSLDTQGLIRVTLHQFYDFALRHDESFAVMADMETD